MAFYEILVERYQAYATRIEANNRAEAERLGRELLPSLTADTDTTTVQARLFMSDAAIAAKGL